MRVLAFAAGVFVLLGSVLYAGELRQIEMSDGSLLKGEIVSLTGGVLTIRTDTIGTVRVGESKVRSIRSIPSPADPAGSAKDPSGEIGSLRQRMTADPDIMNKIRALQDDPDFQKVLEDPEMMKAVSAGDIAALMANPQFMKLLNKDSVQDIQKKLQ